MENAYVLTKRLSRIYVLDRVAESGSFAEVGRELGLCRSVVAHHVATLEAELGHELLVRQRRTLALTPAGRALLGRFAPIFAALREVDLATAMAEGAPGAASSSHAPLPAPDAH
jgi:LysR family transcriptional regulator for bpeEF and oprC